MALAGIVRSAVKLAKKLTASFQGPVLIHRWTGENVMGDPVAPSDVSPMCIVDLNPGKTYKEDGIEKKVRAMVYILEVLPALAITNRTNPIDVRDVFVIPGVDNARVVNTPGIQDPTTAQPYFSEVVIG